METITETTEFTSGEHLWDWLVHSNPIVGTILAELDLNADQTRSCAERWTAWSANAPAAAARPP